MVPGTGSAPCRQCSIRRRMDRRVALGIELIEQPWVRDLFQEFCAWECFSRTAGNVTRRIDTYAAGFAQIDRHVSASGALTQDSLLRIFGAEGLRRQHLIIRFLTDRLPVAWDAGRTGIFVAARRIEDIIAASDGLPLGHVLRAYRDYLVQDDRLRLVTVRLYLKAAFGLCEHSGCTGTESMQQSQVNHYLRRTPGQKASLALFLNYLNRITGSRLRVPLRRRVSKPKDAAGEPLHAVGELLDRLDCAEHSAEGRALLAATISKLFLVPLSTVLSLKASDTFDDGSVFILWPEGLALRLTQFLANELRLWASWDSGYLFPGRNTLQPLSRDAVRYHVVRAGRDQRGLNILCAVSECSRP